MNIIFSSWIKKSVFVSAQSTQVRHFGIQLKTRGSDDTGFGEASSDNWKTKLRKDIVSTS